MKGSTTQKATAARHRELFARVMQRERRIALIITVLAICAVFVDMAWQAAVPMAGPVDLLLQVFMGCAFLGILAWHVVNPASHIQRSLLGLVVIAVFGQVGRMYAALFGFGWNNPPDLALPTALGYLPLLVIASFAFLPQRDAIRWSSALMVLVMVPTAVYLLFHLHFMSSSPRLIDLMHMAMLHTPLAFLIGLLITRVHVLAQMHGEVEERLHEAGVDETDAATMTFNRTGLGRVLQEAVETAKLKHQELTVGYLEFVPSVPDEQIEERMRRAVSLMRQEFPAEQLVLGRWSARRLMFLLHDETVAPASRACLLVLEGLNREEAEPGQRPASMGIAAYHPGETMAGLLKRVDDRLQEARQSSGLGLAFSGGDAF